MKKLLKMLVCAMVVTGVLGATTLNVLAKENPKQQRTQIMMRVSEDDELFPPAH